MNKMSNVTRRSEKNKQQVTEAVKYNFYVDIRWTTHLLLTTKSPESWNKDTKAMAR